MKVDNGTEEISYHRIIDEAIHGRVRAMAKTQNKSDSHEAMEEVESHLQKPKLSKMKKTEMGLVRKIFIKLRTQDLDGTKEVK